MAKKAETTGPEEPGYNEWLTRKVENSRRRGGAVPHDDAMKDVEASLEGFLARRRTA